MTWVRFVAFFKEVIPNLIKTRVVPLILNALGLAGGVWGWIVSTILIFVWEKAETEAEREARLADQKNIDDDNIDQYKKDKQEGAPVETLIKDETNLLNGNKPK